MDINAVKYLYGMSEFKVRIEVRTDLSNYKHFKMHSKNVS